MTADIVESTYMVNTRQFGNPLKVFTERPCAYAVVLREDSVLVLNVRGKYHLPGGGIDEYEEKEQALIREVREETGYEVSKAKFIGTANQFFPETKEGPLNKLGSFYKVEVSVHNPAAIIEDDHQIVWLPLKQMQEAPISDFQKWAIEEACK